MRGEPAHVDETVLQRDIGYRCGFFGVSGPLQCLVHTLQPYAADIGQW